MFKGMTMKAIPFRFIITFQYSSELFYFKV